MFLFWVFFGSLFYFEGGGRIGMRCSGEEILFFAYEI